MKWLLLVLAPFTGEHDLLIGPWSSRKECEAGYQRLMVGVSKVRKTAALQSPHVCLEVK